MSRPLKMTPATRDAIAIALARGMTIPDAARHVGVALRSLETWLNRARKADHARRAHGKTAPLDKPYLDLFDEIEEAQDDADLHALRQIAQGLTIGVDLESAVDAAGVPVRMFERLHNRAIQAGNRRDAGERLTAEEQEYVQMLDGFQQARARLKVTSMASLHKHISEDGRLALAYLERLYPDEFANPSKRRAGVGGRPVGATSAPDRPSTADEPPPRIRLREVR